MNRAPSYIFDFEKLTRRPGQYLNSPPICRWSYCGRYRGRTAEEALEKAKFAVGSSLVRVMSTEDKGYL